MRLLEKNIRPRDIMTREAFENAIAIVAATGGSTNAALHLPALAHECGREAVARRHRPRQPAHADHRRPQALRPYTALDVYNAGGIPAILKVLLDAGLLHGDCLTVTGKTIARESGRRDAARRTRT